MPGETSVTGAGVGRSADTPPATIVTRAEPTLRSDGARKFTWESLTNSTGAGLPSSSTCTPASVSGQGKGAAARAPFARFEPYIVAMPPGESPGAPEAALTGAVKLKGPAPEPALTTTDAPVAPSTRAASVCPTGHLKLTRPSPLVTELTDIPPAAEASTRTPG